MDISEAIQAMNANNLYDLDRDPVACRNFIQAARSFLSSGATAVDGIDDTGSVSMDPKVVERQLIKAESWYAANNSTGDDEGGSRLLSFQDYRE